eukprot:212727-Amphidinium_carterae.1
MLCLLSYSTFLLCILFALSTLICYQNLDRRSLQVLADCPHGDSLSIDYPGEKGPSKEQEQLTPQCKCPPLRGALLTRKAKKHAKESYTKDFSPKRNSLSDQKVLKNPRLPY